MMSLLKKFAFTILFFAVAMILGCGAKFIVKSDPSEADVYARIFGNDEKILLGKTPLTMTQSEILEKSKIDPSGGEFFELIVERKDYKTNRFLVPPSRLGHRETILFTKLKTGAEDGMIANTLLQHLFNAQKLANQSNFERAQAELDKAFEIDPKFTRAMSLRGSILFLQKRYDESLKWFSQALEIDPKFEDALKMISEIKKISSGGDEQRLPSSNRSGP